MNTAANRASLFKLIALSGLCAGVLDIIDALVFYGCRGVSPVRVLQGIAFALVGRQAYSMGVTSASLGLLLHFLIATCVAAVYILASRKLPLSQHPIWYGAAYGLAVYLVMNYVVLPLSHIGPRPLPSWPVLLNGVLALIFCVGIPIAWMSRSGNVNDVELF